MADQINYYEILGVSRNASRSEIRNAYRNLAKERHPDHPGGSAEDFARLQEAHTVLSDPNRRQQHDEALDLAYAADQLAGLNLDFGSLDDELSARRQQRESSGPGFGERLRERFRRKESPQSSRPRRGETRTRGRYEIREARWHEPHYFEPEPIEWKTGAISFVAAFVVFIVFGQIGLWSTVPDRVDPGVFAGIGVLAPFMPILYILAGLITAYFAYRYAGYVAVALVFIAALVVGGSGGPEGMLQYNTLGIAALLIWIYLGSRRAQMSRQNQR